MSAQRLEASAAAHASGPCLLGVPMPARAFGLAPGWCRAAIEADASASGAGTGADRPMSPTERVAEALVDDLAFVREWKRTHRRADRATIGSEVAAA